VYIECSPLHHRQYMERMNAGSENQSLSETRWSTRFTNLRIVDGRLPEIIKTLTQLSRDDVGASQLCKSLIEFDIIFSVKLLRLVFGYANAVSEYLQRSDVDLLNAIDRVAGLKVILQ